MSQGLKLAGLSARYGANRVLHGVDAGPLPRGEVTAVLGPNGCGKSTLLKALAGLVPSGGEARIDEQVLGRLDLETRARHVVYLPQSLPPTVHLRVYESVLVAANAARRGLTSPPRHEAVTSLLERLGIAGLAMRYLDELSGGQKQLAGLAQALIREPDVLLLDEPLSALDLNHQFHVMALIAQETCRRGMVTLIVLHDINIALRHTDRILLLKAGGVVACGRPDEVVTPAALAHVYGVSGRVETCSRGRLNVLIDGLCD